MENPGIKPWLWDFALETIATYSMDDSHGINHFVNTYNYVNRIIEEDFADAVIIPYISIEDTKEILGDAAFAHDLIDGKYINEGIGLTRFINVFRKNNYNPYYLDIIVYIITRMSFSKRHARRKNGIVMIEPSPYALAVGIVVDADQLDAYDPERCRVYQETKFARKEYHTMDKDALNELSRRWQATILKNRVLLYRDHYMNTRCGKKIAAVLHEETSKYVAREFSDVIPFDY